MLSGHAGLYCNGAGLLCCAVLQLSILLPCWDSFATEGLKDRLAEALWELPAVKCAGLKISAIWGAVLTCCSIIALVSWPAYAALSGSNALCRHRQHHLLSCTRSC